MKYTRSAVIAPAVIAPAAIAPAMTALAAGFLSLLLHLLANAASYVPPELESWRRWVIEGDLTAGCPRHYDGDKAAVCAWPGMLEISAQDRGARFRQSWTVYRESLIPLPGDARSFVKTLSAAGVALPVSAMQSGQPAVTLAAGTWHLEGEIDWPALPPSLTVPRDTALVALSIRGQPVNRVVWQGNAVRLSAGSEAEAERDKLEIVAGRAIEDTLPMTLVTHFDLAVSGRPREVTLGPLLPGGFVPTALESELPARLDTEGHLTIQLRSGDWSVKITARATAPVAELARPELTVPWPENEFWAFRPRGELRSVRLRGATQLSPGYQAIPEGLMEESLLYALPAGGRLIFEEISRGVRRLSNKVSIGRDLWFDFAGAGFTLHDRLRGTLLSTQRLDIAPPYRLSAVTETDAHETGMGNPLLVTLNPENGAEGVEVRQKTLALNAQARGPASWAGISHLPLAAWNLPLDELEVTLHLPLATRLIAAAGYDEVSGDWLGEWNLGDVFVWILIIVLAWRIGRWTLVLPAGLWVALARHEAGAGAGLLLTLLLVLLLSTYARDVGTRLRAWLRRTGFVLLALFAVQLVWFAVPVIEAALYPQLEARIAETTQTLPASAPKEAGKEMALARSVAAPVTQELEMDRIVTGSRLSQFDLVEDYDENAILQAGAGIPSWSWHRHTLSRKGPIAPEETQAVWIAPPWLVRLWRFLMIGLAGLLLAQLARRVGLSPTRWMPQSGALAAVMLIGQAAPLAVLSEPLSAADFPPPELLTELRQRLTRDPPCAPDCVTITAGVVRVGDRRLTLELNLHAAAFGIAEVPLGGKNWRFNAINLDGRPAAIRAVDENRAALAVTPGIHTLTFEALIDGRDEIAINFPETPHRLDLELDGWTAEGLEHGRLLGRVLVLYRKARSGLELASGAEIPPFVEVERQLALGAEFIVSTQVWRRAPENGAFSVRVPLIEGEQVISDQPPKIIDGEVEVAFSPSETVAVWLSRLPPARRLILTAPEYTRRIEKWVVGSGGLWHMTIDGPPLILSSNDEGHYPPQYTFIPLPGETLTIQLERPKAVPGNALAYDQVALITHHQGRTNLHELDTVPRPTLSGVYPLVLGADVELLRVEYNGRPLDLELEDGVIYVPLAADSPSASAPEQHLYVQWRTAAERAWRVATPPVDLKAPAANVRLEIGHEGRPRWILWTSGPELGPAVRFWSLLIGVALIALLLAQSHLAPLGFHHWLLLGLGFTAVGGFGFWLVAAWLLALSWRSRWQPKTASYWLQAAVQVALVLLTLVALAVLFQAIESGLLASPDMHIAGWRNRYDPALTWFADQSLGPLPKAAVNSAPLWVYRLAMLAWSLWLALLIVRWLRFGWQALNAGGLWPARRRIQSKETILNE